MRLNLHKIFPAIQYQCTNQLFKISRPGNKYFHSSTQILPPDWHMGLKVWHLHVHHKFN